jgi:hypothetical protein
MLNKQVCRACVNCTIQAIESRGEPFPDVAKSKIEDRIARGKCAFVIVGIGSCGSRLSAALDGDEFDTPQNFCRYTTEQAVCQEGHGTADDEGTPQT